MLKKKFNKIPTPFNVLYIRFTSNNIIVTITNNLNEVITTVSSGAIGFKSHKKITTSALNEVLKTILNNDIVKKTHFLLVKIIGSNDARVGLLDFFDNINYSIIAIEEYFSFPYNGCRPKKRRKI